jgi:hypothetical protein
MARDRASHRYSLRPFARPAALMLATDYADPSLAGGLLVTAARSAPITRFFFQSLCDRVSRPVCLLLIWYRRSCSAPRGYGACTLLERDRRPRAYYSVQVKSTMEPWTFASPESVRWIIEHPLPIFLGIVLKAEARILIYPTTPRFAAWILPLHKDHLELIPGTQKRAQSIETSWEEGSSFELNH